MTKLMKYHFFTIDTVSYGAVAILLIGGYLASIPPTFLFFVVIISLPISLYYYSHKNNTDRFLISLPISPSTIIQSRYMFTSMMTIIVLVFQVIIMIASSVLFDGTEYMYTWQDIVSLFFIACIGLAIIIFFYHLISSFILATTIISLLFFIAFYFTLNEVINVMHFTDVIIFNDLDPGLALIVEKYIPFQPYIILGIISLTALYISMKVSDSLYSSQDK